MNKDETFQTLSMKRIEVVHKKEMQNFNQIWQKLKKVLILFTTQEMLDFYNESTFITIKCSIYWYNILMQ